MCLPRVLLLKINSHKEDHNGGCEMLICKSSFTILFISICMPCAIHNNTDEFNYMQSVIQGLEAKYNPMYDISICKSELER